METSVTKILIKKSGKGVWPSLWIAYKEKRPKIALKISLWGLLGPDIQNSAGKRSLKLKLWHITKVHITTLCTNFERNQLTFISKSVPVSQAEALKCFVIPPNSKLKTAKKPLSWRRRNFSFRKTSDAILATLRTVFNTQHIFLF